MRKLLFVVPFLFASSFAQANPQWWPHHHHHQSIWHCTAYPEGHGHDWGFSARDIHYEHAYHQAMETCEHNTGHHCHHVDCHQDFH